MGHRKCQSTQCGGHWAEGQRGHRALCTRHLHKPTREGASLELSPPAQALPAPGPFLVFPDPGRMRRAGKGSPRDKGWGGDRLSPEGRAPPPLMTLLAACSGLCSGPGASPAGSPDPPAALCPPTSSGSPTSHGLAGLAGLASPLCSLPHAPFGAPALTRCGLAPAPLTLTHLVIFYVFV